MSWRFRKKSDSAAEVFQKRATRQRKILRKDRYDFAVKTANPQIIIKISGGAFSSPASVQEKVWYGSWRFSKKNRS